MTVATRAHHAPPGGGSRVGDDMPEEDAPAIGRISPVSVAVFVAVNLLVITHTNIKFVGPALVFWLMFVQPTYLLFTTSLWGERCSGVERFAYAVASALMLLLVGGLALNTVLPWVNVPRPLDSNPILILVDAFTVVLFFIRRARPAIPRWHRLNWEENAASGNCRIHNPARGARCEQAE